VSLQDSGFVSIPNKEFGSIVEDDDEKKDTP